MSIREFVNAHRLQRIMLKSSFAFPPPQHFPPSDTDLFATPDRKLLLAINRRTGKFIAQQGENCVAGLVNGELSDEEISLLTSASDIPRRT